MTTKVALQTFTIRKYLKTPSAIEAAFERVRGLGISTVELAYIKFKPEEVDAVEAVSKRLGMRTAATQITYSYLDKNRNWVLKFHEQLGCEYACVSVLPTPAIKGGREGMLKFASEVDALGAYYRARGLNLCFHHHDFEFRRLGDSLGLDLLARETDPANVGLMLDTYWMTRGGQSAPKMIRKFGNRVKGIHLRDFGLKWKLLQLTPDDVELGAGNLDIAEIVEVCRDVGVAYMAIEQSCNDPFASIEQSVDHLHKLGFEALF